MKFTKFIYALMAVPALLLASCSEYEDKEVPSDVYNNDNVRFAAATNGTYASGTYLSTELEPSYTQFTIDVIRDSEQEATYNIVVVENEDDSFIVPETVSFAAGAKEAQFTVSMAQGAKTGEPLKLALTFDDSVINPYNNVYATYLGKVSIVKWNNLGKGQFLDTFTFATADDEGNLLDMAAVEVDIYQRDDKPEMYRIQTPYTAAVLDRFEWTGWYGDISTEPIELSLVKGADATYVAWGYWGTNLNYLGEAANPIVACNQRAFGAEEDLAQTVVYDQAGENILYFSLKPEFYAIGLSSFGPAPVYIAMPDCDLASMLQIPVCGLDAVNK